PHHHPELRCIADGRWHYRNIRNDPRRHPVRYVRSARPPGRWPSLLLTPITITPGGRHLCAARTFCPSSLVDNGYAQPKIPHRRPPHEDRPPRPRPRRPALRSHAGPDEVRSHQRQGNRRRRRQAAASAWHEPRQLDGPRRLHVALRRRPAIANGDREIYRRTHRPDTRRRV